MYETTAKPVFDWDTEVNVNITLKELAVMYSFLYITSTRDADRAVKKAVRVELDVYNGDLPFRMYENIQKIITDHGVSVNE